MPIRSRGLSIMTHPAILARLQLCAYNFAQKPSKELSKPEGRAIINVMQEVMQYAVSMVIRRYNGSTKIDFDSPEWKSKLIEMVHQMMETEGVMEARINATQTVLASNFPELFKRVDPVLSVERLLKSLAESCAMIAYLLVSDMDPAMLEKQSSEELAEEHLLV